MPDTTITSATFVAVTLPGVACKMQVHDAPVYVTFTAAGVVTKGLKLYPGDVIPIGATNTMRARKADDQAPVLVFEVFG